MIIEFSEFNLKLLFFLIYPVFIRIQDYTSVTYIKEDKDNLLFLVFRCFLSFIFSGIFVLILYIRTRKIERNSKLNKLLLVDKEKVGNLNQLEILGNAIKRKKIIINIIYLLLLSAIGFFATYGGYYFKKKDYSNAKHSVRTFFEITNFAILSYFLIKQRFYKHHYISYFLITLILIAIFIISFPYLKDILGSFIFYFLYELAFGLYDVLIKRYMNECYKTPYYTMLMVGIIITVCLLIYDVIAYFVNPDVSGIIIGFRDNIDSVGCFFLFLLDLLVEYIWNLGIWILIYTFSPCHYFISEYVSEYMYYILKYKEKHETDEFYSTVNCALFSIFFILTIFFCIIFNEVLILNFWGLDYNTNKRIKKREKKEYDQSENDNVTVLNDLTSVDRDSRTSRESSNSINSN